MSTPIQYVEEKQMPLPVQYRWSNEISIYIFQVREKLKARRMA